MGEPPGLLDTGDPQPVLVHREQGASRIVLIADHAGQRIPAVLGALGLPQGELDRHIGWDIGIEQVTRQLADHLDAVAILQRYSRLVIDCNRPPGGPGSIVRTSDGTLVPGNADLSPSDVAMRSREIFAPYHQRIAQELDSHDAMQPAILIAMHSFTPVFGGQARPWHAGVLYQRDARLAQPLLAALRREPGLVVGDNEPYAVSDATDYAIPVHGEQRGLLHVELEIRQDLIAKASGQAQWAARLARLLPPIVEDLARQYGAPVTTDRAARRAR